MELSKAVELLNQPYMPGQHKNKLMLGMLIFNKYTDENTYETACAEHDEIYYGFGEDDELIEKMSESDLIELGRLGWSYEDGSFHLFT